LRSKIGEGLRASRHGTLDADQGGFRCGSLRHKLRQGRDSHCAPFAFSCSGNLLQNSFTDARAEGIGGDS
jgi:hypothetical protein